MQERTSAPQFAALANDEPLRMVAAIDAQMQASLMLGRATLCALAAMSPLLSSVADAALQEEIDTLARLDASASGQVTSFLEDSRVMLQRVPTEVRAAPNLERALMAAATALPPHPHP